jgi:ABC-type nickel/cobalt efflux system permease component RcnA
MTGGESFSLKKLSLWLAILGVSLVTAYIILVAVVSINAGLHHPEKDGFWVPILAGGLCILIATWLFFRSARFFYHLTKRSDRLQM